jgi:hypothetical protein
MIRIEIETTGIATRIGIATGIVAAIEMTTATDGTRITIDRSRREWDCKQQCNS